MAETKSSTEVWKAIVGYEGYYEVSNLGRVRSLDRFVDLPTRWGTVAPRKHRGRLITLANNGRDYLFVQLHKDGAKRHYVHSLVAEAFNGPRPAGFHIHHRDHNRTNNVPENLEYTPLIQHASIDGRYGENHVRAKITASDVMRIRAMLVRGDSQGDIAKTLSIPESTITPIATGTNWAAGPFPPKWEEWRSGAKERLSGEGHFRARLSDGDVLEIRKLVMEGCTRTEIAERFSATLGSISGIVCAKSRKKGPFPDGYHEWLQSADGKYNRGERNQGAKLTAIEVREIRALILSGSATYGELAERYGVKKEAISAIKRRATWRHLDE